MDSLTCATAADTLTGRDGVEEAPASTFRPALILMGGRTLAFVASFGMPIVLVRLFSQSEFGTYKQLFLIYATLFAIAQCGMAESLFFFMPGNPRRAGRYVVNALLGLAVAGLLSLGLLVALAPYLSHWFHNPAIGGYLPLIGVFLLLMLVSATLEIVMTAKKQHALASGSYAITGVVRAACCLVPPALAWGLRGLLYGAIVFAGLRVATTLYYLRHEFHAGLRFSVKELGQHLAYALPFAAAVLLHTAQANLHLFAVSAYFNAATYAIYAVGCLQVPLVDLLMTSTGNVMMVRMRETPEPAAALAIWRDITRKLALILVPGVAALLVVAHPLIVTLFTAKYARSVPIFMVWSLFMLFPILLTDGTLRVYAQTRYLILVYAVNLAVVGGSIWWSMAKFGLLGAVGATLLATFVAKAVALHRIRRLWHCSWRQLLPWSHLGQVFALAAIAGIPAYALETVLTIPALPRLTATLFVYGMAYGGMMLIWGPLNRSEREALFAWARRPAMRLLRH